MELDLNTLVGEHFSTAQLTMGINKRQNEYGMLNRMGLFSETGIDEDVVKIETRNQTLSIIPSSPVGTPPPSDDDPDDREQIPPIPTFRHAKKHTLLARALQGKRAFGTLDIPETPNQKMAEMLDKIEREHLQTREYLRWHALKGNVYDADGAKVLYNVYDLMGETQKTVDWDFNNASAVDPVLDGTNELFDYMEDQALGEDVMGILMLCSPGYFDALQKNKSFRDAYAYYAEQMGEYNPNRDFARSFHYKGITYVRHRGSCRYKKKDGSWVTHPFIPANQAIAVPTGTMECFRTFFSPGEFLDTVNTEGLPIYIKPKVMDLDMGIELNSFSYQLNLVTKPRLVVKCTITS